MKKLALLFTILFSLGCQSEAEIAAENTAKNLKLDKAVNDWADKMNLRVVGKNCFYWHTCNVSVTNNVEDWKNKSIVIVKLYCPEDGCHISAD